MIPGDGWCAQDSYSSRNWAAVEVLQEIALSGESVAAGSVGRLGKPICSALFGMWKSQSLKQLFVESKS